MSHAGRSSAVNPDPDNDAPTPWADEGFHRESGGSGPRSTIRCTSPEGSPGGTSAGFGSVAGPAAAGDTAGFGNAGAGEGLGAGEGESADAGRIGAGPEPSSSGTGE